MPLSEEELRLLEQMERALVHEDPKFASTLRGTALQQSARRRAILAGIGFLLGISVLMAGAILQVTALGIVGFVLMLTAATIGIAAWRGRGDGRSAEAAVPDPGGGHTFGLRPPGSSGSFKDRLDERWRRRRGDDHDPS